jgi:hypothetical protein
MPTIRLALVATLVCLFSRPVAAQEEERMPIPLSQFGSVTQRVGYTDIEVRYRRPVARGRELFGGIVDWGRTWTPGADSATTLAFSTDVRVNDRALPAGKYSLWLVPAADGPWTAILSHAAEVYHAPYPGEEHDALRVAVVPERGSHMEVLGVYFPEVGQTTAVLRVHWGGTIVPLRIDTGGG